LAGVATHGGRDGIKFQIQPYPFRGQTEPLQLHRLKHHFVQRHPAPFWLRFSRIQKELPQDRAGALRFPVDLSRFLRAPGGIAAQQQAESSSPAL
jgi:hypothetical protein